MGANTRRYVMTFCRELTIGWPEDINFRDAPDEPFVASRFSINSPERGFCAISRLGDGDMEFCHDAMPALTLASLPGPPVDPFDWMQRGCVSAKITPFRLTAGAFFRLAARYSGLIPKGMNAGDSYRLSFLLIGQADPW